MQNSLCAKHFTTVTHLVLTTTLGGRLSYHPPFCRWENRGTRRANLQVGSHGADSRRGLVEPGAQNHTQLSCVIDLDREPRPSPGSEAQRCLRAGGMGGARERVSLLVQL